jgi:meso-butanediol dehydrogenase / (S,S)-butanediol dehydrogenase / diacetyl reductase
MSRLSGRRAVITGGGRGIGASIARAFAAEGAAVLIAARSTDQTEAVAREISTAGGLAIAMTVDVTDDASVSTLAQRAPAALGGPADVLVNNAGRYLPRRFLDYSAQEWAAIMDANLLGAVRVTQAFLPEMLAKKAGRIINIASTAGKYGTAGQSAYNASKHAILGLTRSLALEVAAQGVRVNAICPGWVDTELLQPELLSPVLGVPAADVPETLARRAPIGRLIRPEEVAALAVYLAAPESDGVTGVGLTLAGGMVLI